jgi:hypothetical protein
MNKVHRHNWPNCVVSVIRLGLPVLGFSESRAAKSHQQTERESQIFLSVKTEPFTRYIPCKATANGLDRILCAGSPAYGTRL